MRTRLKARHLLNHFKRRIGAALRPPLRPHRPDLSDAKFVAGLLPLSAHLRSAKASQEAGEYADARRRVVDHFVGRTAPRFFCDLDRIDALCARLEDEHPAWLEALRDTVSADLNVGLRVIARRDTPLLRGFEWTGIPPGPGEDDLYSAQPHRFGFMPRLALAAHFGMPTLNVIASTLDAWIAATELGEPRSFHSPLLVLYRVLALSWTFAFIAGLPPVGTTQNYDLLFLVLKILFADANYLQGTIGEAYPNNHLLADGFSGWFCGTLFPEFRNADTFKAKGEFILSRELMRQFLDDGTSFEHSTHYHEMGCEMAVAYVLLSRRNGTEPRHDIVERLRHMLEFQTALSGVEATPIPIGNCTEDPLFPLDAGHGWAAGAMQEFYRALFDAGLHSAPSDDFSVERAYWMLGGALRTASDSSEVALPWAFEKGGFYILEDAAKKARLVFRSGPVEGLPICAGHAHADLLSVYLSVGGIPLIVDAGTYTYRFNRAAWPEDAPPWRRYFAGPASHNGLMPGADPCGEMVGDFRDREIPCRVQRTRNERSPGLTWLEFQVTGESAANGHRRGVVHVAGRYWLVYDLIPETLASASIGLQFAPGARAELADSGAEVNVVLSDARCRVALSPGLRRPQLLTGSIEPLAGWVSPRYGEMAPAPQMRARINGANVPPGFLLQAAAEKDEARSAIVAAMSGRSWIAFRVADGGFEDVLLIKTSSDPMPMSAWGIDFDGELLWLRSVDGEKSERCSVDRCRN